MSGSSHSKYADRKINHPSSLKGNHTRKRMSKAPDGNKGTQSRAEFRDPDYVSKHSLYEPAFAGSTYVPGRMCRHNPYQARQPVKTSHHKTSGLVDEFDESVRARNMPIVFEKQMRERGDPLALRIHKVLFPTDSQYTCEPKFRPNVGCCLTRFWSDHQVETWSKYARYMRIQYSGKLEYSFPSATKGITRGGIYYSRDKPWPKPGEDVRPPKFNLSRGRRKRSDFSRIKRSLKRIKEVAVKPLDFSTLIVQRRVLPQREIRRRWRQQEGIPFCKFKESIPYCLSLNTKKPHPVPLIVLDALKRIAGRVSKLFPSKPWILEDKEVFKPSYQMKLESSPISRFSNLRLLLSMDGNVYATRGALDGRHNLINKVPPDRYKSIVARIKREQAILDSYSPDEQDHVPATFGSWDEW